MVKLTFIFNGAKFEVEDTIDEYGLPTKGMMAANDHFRNLLGPKIDDYVGCWYGPQDGCPENTWVYQKFGLSTPIEFSPFFRP